MQGTAKLPRKSYYSVPQPLFFIIIIIFMALHIPADYWYNLTTAFYSCLYCTHPLNSYLTYYCLLSYLRTLSLSFLLRHVQKLYAFYKTVNKDRKWKLVSSKVSCNTSEFPGFYQGKKISILSKAVGRRSKITLRYLAYNSGVMFKRMIPKILLTGLNI